MFCGPLQFSLPHLCTAYRLRESPAQLEAPSMTAALDLRSLALARIGAGCVVLADLASRLPNFRLHYTDGGILPRELIYEQAGFRFPSAYAMSDWHPYLIALFVLHALAGLSLALGYRTRTATAVAWYLTLSLQERCFMANNGGDKVLATLLFWGLFLPWGQRLSIDSPKTTEGRAHSMATAIVLLQPVSIYLISVFHKLEPTWLQGKVLHYALQSDFYAYPLARQLLPYPSLLTALAYGTLTWEMLGPFLLLSPSWRLRALACGGFAAMHLSFGLFLRIGLFALTPSLYLLALLPSELWDTVPFQRLARTVQNTLTRVARYLPSPPAPSPPPDGPALRLALGMLFLHSTSIALGQDARLRGRTSEGYESLAYLTGLHQRWTVFVDTPNIFDGWLVVEAQLQDGRQVDLWQGNDPVRWDKPATPYARYGSFRWPTPLALISEDARFFGPFVKALARDWRRDHPADRVLWARLVLFREQAWLDYRRPTVTRLTLWEGNL